MQVELAEQKRSATLQRQEIAKFLESTDAVDEVATVDNKPEPAIQEDGRTAAESLRTLNMAPVDGEFQVSGEIENLSDQRFRNLIFHVELFDAGSRPIETLPVTIEGLEAGATRAFIANGLIDRPGLRGTVKRFKITAALLSEEQK